MGVWVWLNNASWVQLYPANVAAITAGDLDGNGQAEVIFDFTGLGVWAWFNNASWVPLHPSNVTGVAVGDLDGSGQSDVILLPPAPVRELWLLIGRRAGKSIVAALQAVWAMCCCSYRLAPGEVGVSGTPWLARLPRANLSSRHHGP